MAREDGGVFKITGARRIGQTTKAIRIEADVFDEGSGWIPVSQVHDDSEVFANDDGSKGTLVVTAWFAKQRGWLEE
jgi:hypothetical protein